MDDTQQDAQQDAAAQAVAVEQPLMDPGPSSPVPLVNQAAVQIHAARFSKAATLSELAEDYVFFTHALLFTHAAWGHDPLAELVVESNGDILPFVVTLPRPVFQYLDLKVAGHVDPTWNYRLIGLPKDQWQRTFTFLCQLVGTNRHVRYYQTSVLQRFRVVDAMWLDKQTLLPEDPAAVPTVEIFGLAVLSNKSTVQFRPDLAKRPDLPVPVHLGPADPRVVREGSYYFKQHRDRLLRQPTSDLPLEADSDG